MQKKIVEKIQSTLHFLRHDLWRIDYYTTHDSKLKIWGIEALRVLLLVVKGTKKDKCKLYASALTFSTLMALVPFFVIVFSISSAIGFSSAKEALLARSVDVPQIHDFVVQLFDLVEKTNITALGSFGGVIFIYIIFKLLNGIEESFNQIWGVKSSRSWSSKVRNYLSVLVITPILLISANFVSIKFAEFSGQIVWMGGSQKLLLQGVSVLMMTVGFVATLLFLPNTHVHFKAALIGGFVSALLAILLQLIMVRLGIGVTRLSKIYGTFAYIPIFLFWLQTSWLILLFGAELSFAVQNRNTYAEERVASQASTLSKIWVAFSLVQESIRIFKNAETSLDLDHYAHQHKIPVRLINKVVESLVDAQIFGRVDVPDKNIFVLLHAPEKISVKKIYDLILAEGSSPEELGLSQNQATKQLLSYVDQHLNDAIDPNALSQFFEDEKTTS